MNALEIKQLGKTYLNGLTALSSVDLTVQPGEFFCLLGLNGAGKSTLIGCISTLAHITKGSIRVFGHDVRRDPIRAKQMIGLMPQEVNLNPFSTVEEVLRQQAGYYGLSQHEAKARMTEVLVRTHLTEKEQTIVQQLSGGMKRRLMLARAVIHQPKLLILDEPTAGVDIDIRKDIWDFLKHLNEQGTTIILTTHYLEEAEQLCERVAILHQGTIVKEGTIHDIQGAFLDSSYTVYLKNKQQSIDWGKWSVTGVSDHSIAVYFKQPDELTEFMAWLYERNIVMTHMESKVNRLERYFLSTTSGVKK